MNEAIDTLRQAGYEMHASEAGTARLFIDATRWWIDEEPGVFRLEPSGELYAIAVLVNPDGTVRLYDGWDGELMIAEPIRFSHVGQLPDIIQNLKRAFCDETTLEEGAEIVRSMLS